MKFTKRCSFGLRLCHRRLVVAEEPSYMRCSFGYQRLCTNVSRSLPIPGVFLPTLKKPSYATSWRAGTMRRWACVNENVDLFPPLVKKASLRDLSSGTHPGFSYCILAVCVGNGLRQRLALTQSSVACKRAGLCNNLSSVWGKLGSGIDKVAYCEFAGADQLSCVHRAEGINQQ